MPYFGLPALDMSQVIGENFSKISPTNAFYAGVSFIVGSQLFKVRAPVQSKTKDEAMLIGQLATLLKTENQSN